MRTTLLLLLFLFFINAVYSQNWLIAGNSGLSTSNFLGTTDARDLIFKVNSIERGRLQASNGAWRFGSSTDFMNIDALGKLTFTGSASYLVGGNKYAFQFSGNTNYGLFFNSTASQYEFRNGSASPVFSINANTGNGVFHGSLKVGPYTLPVVDGNNGQVLTTNGAGVVTWTTAPGGSGGANTSLSNLTVTSVNQSLVPLNDSAVDLGSKINAWKNLFVDGKVGVNIDPVAKLDIKAGGSSSATSSLRVSNLFPFGGTNTLFLVRDDGRVGIGTANPSANLHVAGTSHFSGNVGIGTVTPTVALHVIGDALYNTTTTDCDLRQKTNNTDMGWYASGSSNKVGLHNYATAKTLMQVLGTGEVAIGGLPAAEVELSINAAKGDKDNLWNEQRIYSNQKYWELSTYIEAGGIDNLYLFTEDGGSGEFNYTSGIYLSHVGLSNNAEKINYKLLQKVRELQPKMINLSKNNKPHKSFGFDVNDLLRLFPNTVYTSKNPKTGEMLYSINYDEFTVIAVKAIQEQQEEITSVKLKNEELEKKNKTLEQRLLKIEMMLSESSVNTDVQTAIGLTDAGRLGQNVPNPFTASTTIAYTLNGQNDNAYINFYTSAGNLLKSVKIMAGGKGTVTLKAGELSPGVYQYTLNVDGKVIDRKQMVITR